MKFQTYLKIFFVVLTLLTSGCVQFAISVEEGTEGVLYRVGHPRPTTQEIIHE